MAPLHLAAPLLALGIVARGADARVPSFVRQTGLVCSQCHVSWTNAADLTFTGLKFRLNGYRTPPASESLEPGKEGAISRHHLALTLARMMSGRVRSNIAQGSKNPSDPMLLEPRANPVTSNVIGPIDLDVAGPIGEHVGVWSDFCAYGGSDVGIVLSTETTCARPGGYIGVSNLAMRIITNLDGNILGFGGSLLSAVRTHSGGSPYTSYGVYAFLADRLGLTVGVEPGDDNLGFKRFNYRAEGALFPLHSDAEWLLLGGMLKAGNDITPSVAGVRGVSALSKGGSGYGSQSISRALRTLYSFGYGFSGRGPHSFVGTFNLAVENEDFNDGSSNRMRAVRSDLRYNFQGKYGVDFYVLRYRRWDFTDASGVEHPIPLDTGFAVRLLYSLAVNFACYIEGGNLQNAKLNQNWREGNYWNVNLQFLW
jgi:hypothetical protein